MATSLPSFTGVFSPPVNRTLSASTNRLTWGRTWPCSSNTRSRRPGWSFITASSTASTVAGGGPSTATATRRSPPAKRSRARATTTVTFTASSRDRGGPHRQHRRQVGRQLLPRLAFIGRPEHLARTRPEVEPGRVGAIGADPVPQHGEVGVLLG